MKELAFDGAVPENFVGSCQRSQCRICWQSKVVDDVKGRGDFAEMCELIDQLLDCYAQESEDRNYYEAIFDGSWPSAVRNLEHALIRAKEFEKVRGY